MDLFCIGPVQIGPITFRRLAPACSVDTGAKILRFQFVNATNLEIGSTIYIAQKDSKLRYQKKRIRQDHSLWIDAYLAALNSPPHPSICNVLKITGKH